MTNLLIVSQPEHAQLTQLAGLADDYAWWTELRSILGEHIAAEMAEAGTGGQSLRSSWHLVVTSAGRPVEANRLIRGATLLHYDQYQRWALLGDEAGQLHVLDLASPPAGLATPQLVDDPRRPVRLLRESPPKPVTWADNPETTEITYDDLQLAPLRVRRRIIWQGFDQLSRRWYRGRYIEHITQEPYTVA